MQYPSIPALAIFGLSWVAGVYLLNCLIARKLKRIDIQQALLHSSAMAMFGLVGEVFIGSIYVFFFHHPLWNYTVFPIHHAYTSTFALYLWGIYGLHLYLLHGTLRERKIQSLNRLALIFCLEAIAVEAAVNFSYKLSFNTFIYYYFPNDLWHFTSVQTLPFYLVAGYVIIKTFRKFEQDPRFFTIMSVSIAGLLAFLA